MLSVLQRSKQLQNVLGIGHQSITKTTYQSHTLHYLRVHLYSNRLCIANGFGFQSLSIAGTNTILRFMNNHNTLNTYQYNSNYNHLQQRHIGSSIKKRKKSTESHNPNWNKKYVHGIEYDVNKELNEVFPETIYDPSESNNFRKKGMDFEYLEFLKQKYRNTAPSKHRQKGKINVNGLQYNSKREFSSIEPGAIQPESVEIDNTKTSPPRVTAAKFAAHQQQIMAKEDEINPTSFGGIMVILLGAAIFYWLYNIDNTKHSGISSFLSRFSKTQSLDDFIKKQQKKPTHKIPDDWTAFKVIIDHLKNAILGLFQSEKYNSEWIWSKLFRLFYIPSPKLLPPTKQTVYTLVVDLDTICHSTWSRKEGFERTMRPYYKEFISRMFMSGWEIVIFGQCEDYDWMESPDFVKLDPSGKGMVQNYLWNKDCYYFNGHRCKDLSRLGRDLKHVITIDNDPRSIQLQPQNGIILSKWEPSKDEKNLDNSLLQLIEFLEYLAKAEVADVTQVLAAYRGKDIAQEFRKRYFAAVQAQLSQQQQFEQQHDGNNDGEESYDEEEDEEDEIYQQ